METNEVRRYKELEIGIKKLNNLITQLMINTNRGYVKASKVFTCAGVRSTVDKPMRPISYHYELAGQFDKQLFLKFNLFHQKMIGKELYIRWNDEYVISDENSKLIYDHVHDYKKSKSDAKNKPSNTTDVKVIDKNSTVNFEVQTIEKIVTVIPEEFELYKEYYVICDRLNCLYATKDIVIEEMTQNMNIYLETFENDKNSLLIERKIIRNKLIEFQGKCIQ